MDQLEIHLNVAVLLKTHTHSNLESTCLHHVVHAVYFSIWIINGCITRTKTLMDVEIEND